MQTHCGRAVRRHRRGVRVAGANEHAEAIGVAIIVNGGPATLYGAYAYAAFCEFAEGPAET